MSTRSNKKLNVRELVIFSMLGTVMFCSKIAMEALPNIHLLGVLTVVYTVVLRKKALFPIYIYVFLNGLFAGFNAWWLPYLYIWTLLWGAVMLLPKNMGKRAKLFVYPLICALHGILFGILYSPVQALIMGMDLKTAFAWILAGLPWDMLHGIGNFVLGFLIFPLTELLDKLIKKTNR